jgi:hypothetical protein
MLPDPQFARQPLDFWAHVRSISQTLGYTTPKPSQVRSYSLAQIVTALKRLNLRSDHIVRPDGTPMELAESLLAYLTTGQKSDSCTQNGLCGDLRTPETPLSSLLAHGLNPGFRDRIPREKRRNRV